MEYGPEIPVNGKRPEFVRDDDWLMVQWDDGLGLSGPYTAHRVHGWDYVISILMEATNPYYKTQINYDLPVQTRDGRAVRILCTDAPGRWNRVGYIECGNGVSIAMAWDENGQCGASNSPGSLVNVPAKPVRTVQWLYANAGTSYDTTQNGANLELIFEDGKLVEAIVHD